MMRGNWKHDGTAHLRALLVCCGLILSGTSYSSAELACGFTPFTRTLQSGRLTEVLGLSDSGRDALLLSNADLAATGGTGFAVYRVTLEGRFPRTQSVRQLGSDGLVPVAQGASGDLGRLIFRSTRDLVGENPDGSQELFLLETETGLIRQLTRHDNRDAVVSAAAISGDGSTVVYVSNANPIGENADGSREVFFSNLPDGALSNSPESHLQQLTHFSSVAVPLGVSVSWDGRFVAYQVRQVLASFTELLVFDRLAGFSELVLTADRIDASFLASDASALLVVSSGDLTGENRDGSLEFFRIDLSLDATEPLAQLSSFEPGVVSDSLAFSGDGRIIAFRSNRELLGWPARGASNFFLFDTWDRSLNQLTHWTFPQQADGRVVLNMPGSHALMTSSTSPVSGLASASREVFLAGCEPARVAYVPQVGNGVAGALRFETSFVLSNTGSDSSIRLDFFDASGNPLPFPLTRSETQTSYYFPLQAGRPLLISSGGQGPIRAGYARIVSGSRVSGNAVFTGARNASNTILYEAAVPLSETMTDFSLVVNTQGNFLTGLALVNPPASGVSDESRAFVTMRLYDEQFEPLAEKSLLLAAGQQTAQFVDRAFAEVLGIGDFVGILTVSSNRGLAAIALRQNDDPRVDFPLKVPTLTTLTVAPGRADQQ